MERTVKPPTIWRSVLVITCFSHELRTFPRASIALWLAYATPSDGEPLRCCYTTSGRSIPNGMLSTTHKHCCGSMRLGTAARGLVRQSRLGTLGFTGVASFQGPYHTTDSESA